MGPGQRRPIKTTLPLLLPPRSASSGCGSEPPKKRCHCGVAADNEAADFPCQHFRALDYRPDFKVGCLITSARGNGVCPLALLLSLWFALMSLAMRLLGTITACFLALIAVSPIHAQPQSNARLPAQAQRWGNLMTDHWLTVDLSRQLDRAVFYHPSNQSFEVERLRQSMSTTEKNLLQALRLYRGL